MSFQSLLKETGFICNRVSSLSLQVLSKTVDVVVKGNWEEIGGVIGDRGRFFRESAQKRQLEETLLGGVRSNVKHNFRDYLFK